MTDYESNLEVPDLQNYIAMIFQKKTPHNLTGLEPGSSVRQADVMTAERFSEQGCSGCIHTLEKK
jgi:hypothetical protein